MCKLVVLDKNTSNHITACKKLLLLLNKSSWLKLSKCLGGGRLISALNNPQELACHKTNQPTIYTYIYIYIYIYIYTCNIRSLWIPLAHVKKDLHSFSIYS